eukprot:TRINITY_DN33053_c0_g1_i1.p1 TRINITY_DN33053_c0_g1~~TRINITY_DN33053_c0_g1_i1.p1  ORF type:complete len:291 (-),score=38.73 TRINITY_DN33053_c0_g1_i1:54-926(-)
MAFEAMEPSAPPLDALQSYREDERNAVDCPQVFAEVSSCVRWTALVLLLLAAVGLCKVDPPGEQELCQVQTLGLENQDQTGQDIALGACHALYISVFATTRVVAGIFVFLAVLCPALLLFLSTCAKHSADAGSTRCLYAFSACANFLFVLILWVPSGWFLTMSGVVTVAMAPITAQWMIIYAVYFGMKAKGDTPPYWMDVIYRAYGACWYADTCLWIGSACMVVLWFFCIIDGARNIAACCKPPRYASGRSEFWRLMRNVFPCLGCIWNRCPACCGGKPLEVAPYARMPA